MAALRVIGQRILSMLPTLFGVVVLAFFINRILPGDPARALLGDQASPQQLQALRDQLGLNKPLWKQFLDYIWGVIHLNFGYAAHTSHPVMQDLESRLPATIELALWAFVIAVVIGVLLGIYQAARSGTWKDLLLRVAGLAGVSIPSFWLGIELIHIFYVDLSIAPDPSGRLDNGYFPPKYITGLYVIDSLLTGNWPDLRDSVAHLILPAVSLALAGIAVISRMTRSSMLEVTRSDYVRTARAKGVRPGKILFGHTLKNAAPTIFTVTAIQLGYLVSGAVIVETIFSWPGIGKYIYDSIVVSDYAPVQAVMVLTAALFIIVNLLADVAHVIVDPKLRTA